MAASASNIIIGANGTVYTAPATSAATIVPANIGSAISGSYADVGFLTEEGATLSSSSDVTNIEAWQAYYPVRVLKTGQSATFEFNLREFTKTTAQTAFGGGTIVAGTVGGSFSVYAPPAPGEIDLRSVVIAWNDSGYEFRAVSPRGLVTGDVSSNIVRTDAMTLPISYTVTPSGAPTTLSAPPTQAQLATQPFYIISNHPSWL